MVDELYPFSHNGQNYGYRVTEDPYRVEVVAIGEDDVERPVSSFAYNSALLEDRAAFLASIDETLSENPEAFLVPNAESPPLGMLPVHLSEDIQTPPGLRNSETVRVGGLGPVQGWDVSDRLQRMFFEGDLDAFSDMEGDPLVNLFGGSDVDALGLFEDVARDIVLHEAALLYEQYPGSFPNPADEQFLDDDGLFDSETYYDALGDAPRAMLQQNLQDDVEAINWFAGEVVDGADLDDLMINGDSPHRVTMLGWLGQDVLSESTFTALDSVMPSNSSVAESDVSSVLSLPSPIGDILRNGGMEHLDNIVSSWGGADLHEDSQGLAVLVQMAGDAGISEVALFGIFQRAVEDEHDLLSDEESERIGDTFVNVMTAATYPEFESEILPNILPGLVANVDEMEMPSVEAFTVEGEFDAVGYWNSLTDEQKDVLRPELIAEAAQQDPSIYITDAYEPIGDDLGLIMSELGPNLLLYLEPGDIEAIETTLGIDLDEVVIDFLPPEIANNPAMVEAATDILRDLPNLPPAYRQDLLNVFTNPEAFADDPQAAMDMLFAYLDTATPVEMLESVNVIRNGGQWEGAEWPDPDDYTSDSGFDAEGYWDAMDDSQRAAVQAELGMPYYDPHYTITPAERRERSETIGMLIAEAGPSLLAGDGVADLPPALFATTAPVIPIVEDRDPAIPPYIANMVETADALNEAGANPPIVIPEELRGTNDAEIAAYINENPGAVEVFAEQTNSALNAEINVRAEQYGLINEDWANLSYDDKVARVGEAIDFQQGLVADSLPFLASVIENYNMYPPEVQDQIRNLDIQAIQENPALAGDLFSMGEAIITANLEVAEAYSAVADGPGGLDQFRESETPIADLDAALMGDRFGLDANDSRYQGEGGYDLYLQDYHLAVAQEYGLELPPLNREAALENLSEFIPEGLFDAEGNVVVPEPGAEGYDERIGELNTISAQAGINLQDYYNAEAGTYDFDGWSEDYLLTTAQREDALNADILDMSALDTTTFNTQFGQAARDRSQEIGESLLETSRNVAGRITGQPDLVNMFLGGGMFGELSDDPFLGFFMQLFEPFLEGLMPMLMDMGEAFGFVPEGTRELVAGYEGLESLVNDVANDEVDSATIVNRDYVTDSGGGGTNDDIGPVPLGDIAPGFSMVMIGDEYVLVDAQGNQVPEREIDPDDPTASLEAQAAALGVDAATIISLETAVNVANTYDDAKEANGGQAPEVLTVEVPTDNGLEPVELQLVDGEYVEVNAEREDVALSDLGLDEAGIAELGFDINEPVTVNFVLGEDGEYSIGSITQGDVVIDDLTVINEHFSEVDIDGVILGNANPYLLSSIDNLNDILVLEEAAADRVALREEMGAYVPPVDIAFNHETGLYEGVVPEGMELTAEQQIGLDSAVNGSNAFREASAELNWFAPETVVMEVIVDGQLTDVTFTYDAEDGRYELPNDQIPDSPEVNMALAGLNTQMSHRIDSGCFNIAEGSVVDLTGDAPVVVEAGVPNIGTFGPDSEPIEMASLNNAQRQLIENLYDHYNVGHLLDDGQLSYEDMVALQEQPAGPSQTTPNENGLNILSNALALNLEVDELSYSSNPLNYINVGPGQWEVDPVSYDQVMEDPGFVLYPGGPLEDNVPGLDDGPIITGDEPVVAEEPQPEITPEVSQPEPSQPEPSQPEPVVAEPEVTGEPTTGAQETADVEVGPNTVTVTYAEWQAIQGDTSYAPDVDVAAEVLNRFPEPPGEPNIVITEWPEDSPSPEDGMDGVRVMSSINVALGMAQSPHAEPDSPFLPQGESFDYERWLDKATAEADRSPVTARLVIDGEPVDLELTGRTGYMEEGELPVMEAGLQEAMQAVIDRSGVPVNVQEVIFEYQQNHPDGPPLRILEFSDVTLFPEAIEMQNDAIFISDGPPETGYHVAYGFAAVEIAGMSRQEVAALSSEIEVAVNAVLPEPPAVPDGPVNVNEAVMDYLANEYGDGQTFNVEGLPPHWQTFLENTSQAYDNGYEHDFVFSGREHRMMVLDEEGNRVELDVLVPGPDGVVPDEPEPFPEVTTVDADDIIGGSDDTSTYSDNLEVEEDQSVGLSDAETAFVGALAEGGMLADEIADIEEYLQEHDIHLETEEVDSQTRVVVDAYTLELIDQIIRESESPAEAQSRLAAVGITLDDNNQLVVESGGLLSQAASPPLEAEGNLVISVQGSPLVIEDVDRDVAVTNEQNDVVVGGAGSDALDRDTAYGFMQLHERDPDAAKLALEEIIGPIDDRTYAQVVDAVSVAAVAAPGGVGFAYTEVSPSILGDIVPSAAIGEVVRRQELEAGGLAA